MIKFKAEDKPGPHTDIRIFVGPDEDHLACSGKITVRKNEANEFFNLHAFEEKCRQQQLALITALGFIKGPECSGSDGLRRLDMQRIIEAAIKCQTQKPSEPTSSESLMETPFDSKST